MNNALEPDTRIDTVIGERGIPNVNDRPSTSAAKRALFIVTSLLFCGFAAGLGYWRYHLAQEKKQAAQEQRLDAVSTVPSRTFQEIIPKPETAPVVPVFQVQPPIPMPQQSSQPTLPGNENKPVQPQILDKSGSDLMVTATGSPENTLPPVLPNNEQEKGDKDGLSGLLTPTKTEKRQASMIGNRNFLLAKGAIIECALQTKLITTVSGMTSCIITRNIYSDNGKILLVERGSTITGEYQARLLQQGMARIFVLWDRIKTWNGVVIALDSPGTDPLGGAGLPGYIDTHFWERFGSALMLSLITSAEQGLISSLNNGSNGNNQYNIGGGGYGGSGIQNLPAEALKYSINIPPTLYKNQGEQAAVYVARDLDFSSVYDVAAE